MPTWPACPDATATAMPPRRAPGLALGAGPALPRS